MSLEQEIAALRDEIQKLTAITTKLLEARTEAIETFRTAAAGQEKKAADKPKAAEKPTPEKEEVQKEKDDTSAPADSAKETAPAQAPATAPTKTASLSTPLADDDFTDAGLKTHVAQYVNHGSSDDKPLTQEERTARMEKVRGVLAHEKIKAKDVASVPQNARKAFRKKIAEFIAEIDESGWLTDAAQPESADLDEL